MNTKSDAPAPALTLKNSAIFNGRFYRYGEPLDEHSLKTMPENLKRYLVPIEPEPDPDEPQERSLTFSLYSQYGVDEKGYRVLKRQAKELNNIAQLKEAAEQAIEEVDSVAAEALEIAQRDHQAYVEGQISQKEIEARRSDSVTAQWYKQQEADAANADAEGFSVEANVNQEQEQSALAPEPATPKPKMKVRFLRRGSVWCRAKKVKRLRPGESVYIRNGPKDFEKIGEVNKSGHLPAAPIKEDQQ